MTMRWWCWPGKLVIEQLVILAKQHPAALFSPAGTMVLLSPIQCPFTRHNRFIGIRQFGNFTCERPLRAVQSALANERPVLFFSC